MMSDGTEGEHEISLDVSFESLCCFFRQESNSSINLLKKIWYFVFDACV